MGADRGRFSVAVLMGLVIVFGVGFAGMRDASDVWYRTVYTLTFLSLLFAAAAARRYAFWFGFAVVGWAYFLIGHGPWFAGDAEKLSPRVHGNPGLWITMPLRDLARDLHQEPSRPAGPVAPNIWLPARLKIWERQDNAVGIGHAMLTLTLALLGGTLSRALEARLGWGASEHLDLGSERAHPTTPGPGRTPPPGRGTHSGRP